MQRETRRRWQVSLGPGLPWPAPSSSVSFNQSNPGWQRYIKAGIVHASVQQWTDKTPVLRADVAGQTNTEQCVCTKCRVHSAVISVTGRTAKEEERERWWAGWRGWALQRRIWRRGALCGSVRRKTGSEDSNCKDPEAGACWGWRVGRHCCRWGEQDPVATAGETLCFSKRKMLRFLLSLKLLKWVQMVNILVTLNTHCKNTVSCIYQLQSSPSALC